MNKKFLSAILFGAMLATSAGTFVSCKDYDDDIKGLQTQIDTNKNAIAELQKLVGAGNWVTSVAASGENLVVTMSNGTSATIAGIKGADGKDGVDGKNAAEWTISEDGFWCKDGEKTTNVAVAQNGKDGKDGATAPSPTISDNGMWVVYSWDAAKGEFVAEETEIPAAGTSAYAVKANGVYTLYIADENGEMQEITLPATCDSFVASNIVDRTQVKVEYAIWKGLNAKDENAAALLKKYPALAELKKNDKVTQGGYLPLMVNPANVELDKNFTYSLVDKDGNVCDVALNNPVKGLLGEWDLWSGYTGTGLVTRSADSEAGVWTLTVVPGYDAKKYAQTYGYAQVDTPAALVVTNANGVSSRTKLSYTVNTQSISGLEINVSGSDIPYAEAIDLFEPYTVNDVTYSAPVSFENEYTGYYIIELANEVNVEKYGLSIAEDGHTLNIANMPADASAITVYVNVTAVGLDGTVKKESNETLTIKQKVAATGNLTAKETELNGKKQIIKWDIKELGMTAVEMDKVLPLLQAELVYEYLNEEGDVVTETPNASSVKFYNAQGKSTNYTQGGTWSNGAAAEFYIEIAATDEGLMAPAVYNVTFAAENDNTVIYSAETTLTTTLPEITEDMIKLASAFVDEDVLQVTGQIDEDGKITYTLQDAFVYDEDVVDFSKFVDADFDETEDDEEEYAHYDWMNSTFGTLYVNPWAYEPEGEYTVEQWTAARNNQMYQVRNFIAEIYLFGNPKNKATYEFQLVVKSTIYSETPASVITIDNTKLDTYFGAEGEDVAVVDVTKAVYAAGPDRGNEYSLYTSEKTGTKDETTTRNNYDAPAVNGDYLTTSTGALVTIAEANLMAMGMSADNFATGKFADQTFYLQLEDQVLESERVNLGTNRNPNWQTVTTSVIYGWKTIMKNMNKYYTWTVTANKKDVWEYNAEIKAINNKTAANRTEAEKAKLEDLAKWEGLFDLFKSTVKFAQVNDTWKSDVTETVVNSALIKELYLEFEKKESEKYASIDGMSIIPASPEKVDVKDVTLKMNLVITDLYGMTMKVPFEVSIVTEEPAE